ncbi:MAG: OadG family protein [Clostridia bacterium]|nr:OadG family protein [Clostridia bacterium]
MINTALAMSFGERTAYAGQVLLIGISAVFGALITLMVVLMLFRKLISGYLPNQQGSQPTPTPPVAAPAPTAPVAPATNDALIAVITAAVAATLAEENSGVVPAFRVVAFQKVNTVSKRK